MLAIKDSKSVILYSALNLSNHSLEYLFLIKSDIDVGVILSKKTNAEFIKSSLNC